MFDGQIDISNENGDVVWEEPVYVFRPVLGSGSSYPSAAYHPDHQPVASLASLAPLDTLPARNGEIHFVQSSLGLNTFYHCVIVGCLPTAGYCWRSGPWFWGCFAPRCIPVLFCWVTSVLK